MNEFVKVNYISYWDGCEEVESMAKVNITTGEVYDIMTVDVDDDYVTCIGEFVCYEDGTMEQVMSDEGKYFIITKSEENANVIEIHGIKYIISEELDEEEIHKICGIAYCD